MPQATVTNVLSPNYTYLKGKDAWRNNLQLTAMAAERIRTSLGPNGAYKMVTYNRGPEKVVKVTRDAVSMLQEIAFQYPTIVILSEAAKIQRQELGDGVKAFVILTAGLLKKADELISRGVHPAVVLKGYEEAAKKALETIDANSQTLPDSELDVVLEAVDCGRSTLNAELRRILLEAAAIARKSGKLDKEKIRIIRKPGASQTETKLIKGLVIKKSKVHPNMPDNIKNPRIALTSERIGTNRLEVKMPSEGPFHMKFDISSPQNMAGYRDAEKQRKANALKKLEDLNVNVLFSQQPIDDFSRSKLLGMNVLAFENVDQRELALIAKATGAKLVGPLGELGESDVGAADALETDKIGLEKTVSLVGCDFATFLVRGSNLQALDELELLIDNSLSLLQVAANSQKTVAGAGAIETQIARQLKTFALQFPSREQLAVDNFARAMLEIPRCLATNNGLNPDDALSQLRKLHAEGSNECGIGADGSCGGKVCVEVAEVKKAVVRRAFEVATLMLRIDEQVTAKEIPKFHKQ